ncbi:hypothetical protein FN976_20450 [Caenimonas sedimenti]|uniref:Polynucleotide kinase n=1 Tax=Caenimonas sedimenti TaxID=2596921 RepID=A0A562ZKK1_9BURK|nr:HAD domain-containing protein [Caenimonas sedimenti]TWO69109.1 hypothetical protein FN976_20450 [Caenimonas sedimenti]
MLDFDGVLHPAQGANVPEFQRTAMLASALAGSDCRIVISSTWRDHYPVDVLARRLGDSLGARVIGVLGPDGRGPYVRYQNILRWLAANPWCTDWRALDDAASEFPTGLSELILCDGRVGLDHPQVTALRRWLRG